jgi:hypothetical protein
MSLMIRSTSGRKPRSSILSASSSTSARTALRSRWRRSDQVEEPARGTDDDVNAGRQRVDLRLVGPAAVDGQHAYPQVDRGGAQVVGDLDRQFPGGHDHEGLRAAALPVLFDQLQQRDAERQGLPVPVRACPMMSCPPARAAG